MKKNTVLITGADGLIGQEVVCQLIEEKKVNIRALDINKKQTQLENVYFFEGDINNPPESLFKGVDTIIHLASVIGVEYTDNHPRETIETIVNGTKKILELSIKNKISRFIMASSSEVYGDNSVGPFSENGPVSPKSVYGSAKLTAEYLCKAFQKEYGIEYTIMRIFNAFGKNQSNKFVIPLFIEKALNSEPIEVFGDGNQTRSFCHVSDIARCIIKIMGSESTRNNTYNIGDPRNLISIRDLAVKIIDLVKWSNSTIKFTPFEANVNRNRQRESYYRLPNISAINEGTGWTPIEDFTEKLIEIINDKKIDHTTRSSATLL